MKENLLFVAGMLALAFCLQYATEADASCGFRTDKKPLKIKINPKDDPNLQQFKKTVKMGKKS